MADIVQKLVGALEAVMPHALVIINENHPATKAARAALSEAKAGGWQPIETAPRDGTRFIAWRKYSTRPLIARYWKDFGWFEDEDGLHLYNLTHWQPLPAPPAQKDPT